MKKLLTIFAIFLCLCLIAFPTVSAFAEPVNDTIDEIIEPIDEEPVVDENATVEALKQQVKELIGKANSLLETSSGVIATRLIPIIIGCIFSGILSAICVTLTMNKIKKWKGLYEQAVTAYKTLEGVKKDPNEIKNITSEIATPMLNELQTALTEAKSILKDDSKYQQGLAELNSKIELINSTVDGLKNGALQAWSASPEAIKALSTSATAKAIATAELESIKLKKAIKEKFGENADEFILEALSE